LKYQEEITMECSTISRLHLDTLSSGIPALPSKKAGQRMEACVWCLLECQHDNGVIMIVTENKVDKQYKIFWKEEDIDREGLFRAYNKDDGPEDGAEAIALLLIRERTDYTAIHRSIQTTGIDYWLGYKANADNQIFSRRDARLEISGILKQSQVTSHCIELRLKPIKQSSRMKHIFSQFM
jgi:hypothetical protein